MSLPINSFLTKAGFVLILSCLAVSPAFSACHCVTPSGSGKQTGADWNNAYAGLPATLVRGDVYYLADGSYGAYTFSTAASGTLTVEIRKAQSYDNCTSTGWNTGTMGSAQAVFPRVFDVAAPYLIVNGNGTPTAQGCGGAPASSIGAAPPTPLDCGIEVDDTSCSSSCIGAMAIESGSSHNVFKYMEWNGNPTPSANEDNFMFDKNGPGSGGSNLYSHIYAHDAGCVWIQYGAQNTTFSSNYFWGTESGGVLADGCHGQAIFFSPPDSNVTINGNVFRDTTGSAEITVANPGTGTSNNIVIYDNVFFASSGAIHNESLNLGTLADGIFGCFNSGVVCTNVDIYQNTIANIGWADGVYLCDVGSGCTATVENNLWFLSYGYATSATPTPPGYIGIGKFTQEYNSVIQSGTGCASGTANVCDASGPIPFTSWAGGVFTLGSENSDWDNRLSLSSPYNTDAAGNPFTTDRGAYQLVQTVQPPTNVTATPH